MSTSANMNINIEYRWDMHMIRIDSQEWVSCHCFHMKLTLDMVWHNRNMTQQCVWIKTTRSPYSLERRFPFQYHFVSQGTPEKGKALTMFLRTSPDRLCFIIAFVMIYNHFESRRSCWTLPPQPWAQTWPDGALGWFTVKLPDIR